MQAIVVPGIQPNRAPLARVRPVQEAMCGFSGAERGIPQEAFGEMAGEQLRSGGVLECPAVSQAVDARVIPVDHVGVVRR
jgi:hypothetical protein